MSQGTCAVAVKLAIHEIAGHPAVRNLEVVTGGLQPQIRFDLDLGFGSRWRASGVSPTGVRALEPVEMTFGATYPEVAPSVSLRPDFDRSHPHIQPWLSAGRVVPCLVDGRPDEFVAARGLFAFVEQLVGWLEEAANGNLLDPNQGWEPVRRDQVSDFIYADAAWLRGLVNKQGGFKFLALDYLAGEGRGFGSFYGHLDGETNVQATFSDQALPKSKWRHGKGLALAVWAGRQPNGSPIIASRYLPEDVSNAETLWRRARELGVESQLKDAISLLRSSREGRQAAVFPMPVVLLARRPYHVIGTDSSIEICPYLVRLTMPDAVLGVGTDEVRPLAFRDALSRDLLWRLSGGAVEPSMPWALLGAGSLGSKIAAHAARAGESPDLVVDRANFSPHNAARHALYPSDRWLGFVGGKAERLSEILKPLGGAGFWDAGDHRALLEALKTQFKKADRPVRLVNTTASLVAREFLCGPAATGAPPTLEAILFGGGTLGVLATEGLKRNPDICEVFGHLYNVARGRGDLGPILFDTAAVSRVEVGQGCGSLTMTMSDARLSVLAGLMAERLPSAMREASPGGGLDLYHRAEQGVVHEHLTVGVCRRLALEGLDGWSVSLSPNAEAAILADRSEYPATETGGVCLGWSSIIAQRIYVTDILPAPPDSARSSSEFVLGVDGLLTDLEDLAKVTGGAIGCVGTWHTHLGGASPSSRDRASAARVGAAGLRPMVFLVHGRDGWRAISASAVTET